jgi:putative transposase
MLAAYATSQRRGRTSAPAILIPVTNAIEALNAKLRRAVRARGRFPTDEAAMKLLFLVLNRSEKE